MLADLFLWIDRIERKYKVRLVIQAQLDSGGLKFSARWSVEDKERFFARIFSYTELRSVVQDEVILHSFEAELSRYRKGQDG